MKLRLLAGALLAVAVLPLAPASANTGCRYIPGRDLTDPDLVGAGCEKVLSTLSPLCTKFGFCTE